MPAAAGEMSMAPSPSSEMAPMIATERSVMSGLTSSDTSSQSSAPSPASRTSVTSPTSIPATRTGVPLFTVAMLAKRVFSG